MSAMRNAALNESMDMTRIRTSRIPAALCVALAASSVCAQTAPLTAPNARISDEAIQTDHATYETLQARIQALNERGRPLRDYHLAKAQCWLDASFHEYTRNDRSAFPQAALDESGKLIVGMEQAVTPLSMETPLVNDAARLRPDLWARAAALKSQPGLACAQQKLACGEVELVHAGNEFKQQQWRHAAPYVQIAEELIGQAQSLAESCEGPKQVMAPPAMAVATATPPAIAVVSAAPLQRNVEWVAGVVFNFDRFGAGDIRAGSSGQLDALVRRVATERLVVKSVRLIGHADRLNGTGDSAYNQRLSERRAATVRDALIALKVDPGVIRTEARGDDAPVQRCERRFESKAELEECLLPNRRVEVVIEAVSQPN